MKMADSGCALNVRRIGYGTAARLLFFSLLNGLLLAQTPPAVFDPLSDPSLIEKGLRSTVPLQVAISAFRAASVPDQRRGEWLREALLRSSSLQPETEAVRTRRAISTR
jgi:hypothetical protein